MRREYRPAPPPLEANEQLVTGLITVGWAVALITLLFLRHHLPTGERWWTWTCATGFAMGLFGLWYVPRLKRLRARAARLRADAQSDEALPQAGIRAADQPADQPPAPRPETRSHASARAPGEPRPAAPGGTGAPGGNRSPAGTGGTGAPDGTDAPGGTGAPGETGAPDEGK